MLGLILAAALTGSVVPSADEVAIHRAEDRWSEAFVTGDGPYLQRLLAAGYVSVGETGTEHPKAAVVAAAVNYARVHPGTAPTPMPATSTIEVTGDLALVRHHAGGSVSVDVFQKRGGEWFAIYSQHTHRSDPG